MRSDYNHRSRSDYNHRSRSDYYYRSRSDYPVTPVYGPSSPTAGLWVTKVYPSPKISRTTKKTRVGMDPMAGHWEVPNGRRALDPMPGMEAIEGHWGPTVYH